MESLSRREDEQLLKNLKKEALKACDPVVSDFANCTKDRLVSVVWACRAPLRAMQDCMRIHMADEKIDAARVQMLRDRSKQTQTNKLE